MARQPTAPTTSRARRKKISPRAGTVDAVGAGPRRPRGAGRGPAGTSRPGRAGLPAGSRRVRAAGRGGPGPGFVLAGRRRRSLPRDSFLLAASISAAARSSGENRGEAGRPADRPLPARRPRRSRPRRRDRRSSSSTPAGGIGQLDRALVHPSPPRQARPAPRTPGPGRRGRLGQRAAGQHEDPFATDRASKRLVSLRPLAPDPMSRRARDVEILDLGLGLGPQVLQELLRPAQEFQTITSKPAAHARPAPEHRSARSPQTFRAAADICRNYQHPRRRGQPGRGTRAVRPALFPSPFDRHRRISSPWRVCTSPLAGPVTQRDADRIRSGEQLRRPSSRVLAAPARAPSPPCRRGHRGGPRRSATFDPRRRRRHGPWN